MTSCNTNEGEDSSSKSKDNNVIKNITSLANEAFASCNANEEED